MNLQMCQAWLPMINFLTIVAIAFFMGLILYKIFNTVKRNESNIVKLDLKIQKAQEDGINKVISIAEKLIETSAKDFCDHLKNMEETLQKVEQQTEEKPKVEPKVEVKKKR